MLFRAIDQPGTEVGGQGTARPTRVEGIVSAGGGDGDPVHREDEILFAEAELADLEIGLTREALTPRTTLPMIEAT